MQHHHVPLSLRFALSLTVAAEFVCAQTPAVFGTHAYEFVPAPGISQQAANAAASARVFAGVAGHLATVSSAAENTFLAGLVARPSFAGAWIGAIVWLNFPIPTFPTPWGWNLQWISSPAPLLFGPHFFGGIEPNNPGSSQGPNMASGVYMNIGPSTFGIDHGRWADAANAVASPSDPIEGYFVEYELTTPPAPPVFYQGHYYQFVWAPTLTWFAASEAAFATAYQGMTGHLATIGSAGENTAAMTAFANAGLITNANPGAWLGGAVSAGGSGRWIVGPDSGTVFSVGATPNPGAFAPWNPGEPNNYGGHVWMGSASSIQGNWLDDDDGIPSPSDPVAGYLIEYEPDGCWYGGNLSPLDTGIGGEVTGTAVAPDGHVWCVGPFLSAGGVPAYGVAEWSGAWSSPSGGVSSASVRKVVVRSTGQPVVGGSFQSIGGVSLDHIAEWNGNSWLPIGSGFSSPVGALAETASGHLLAAHGPDNQQWTLKQWDGVTWTSLGVADGPIECILPLPNGRLAVGGRFTNMAGVAAANIALFDGAAWSAAGAGMNGGVLAMAMLPNARIAAVGEFTSAGNIPAARIATWDGVSWQPMGSGLNATARAVASLPDGQLLVGGDFVVQGSIPGTGLARWNGAQWVPVGMGVDILGILGPARVNSITMMPGGAAVVGGRFDTAAGRSARGVAILFPGCIATSQSLGSPCLYSQGMQLTADNLPWLGTMHQQTVVGLTPGSLPLAVFGFEPLGPIGLPQSSCSLFVQPDVYQLLFATGSSAAITLTLPMDAAINNLKLYDQVVELVPPSFYFRASNALRLNLGSF